MTWGAPITQDNRWKPYAFYPTNLDMVAGLLPEFSTFIPMSGHPGSYAFRRKNHIHEGVDLYCPEGTRVAAVETGEVVAVIPFTGPRGASPWWEDTDAVLVEGESGVVVYGEVESGVKVGTRYLKGDKIGWVKRVLKVDKGRPMSMLHLELHDHGTRDAPEWPVNGPKPATLRDPTPYLLEMAGWKTP